MTLAQCPPHDALSRLAQAFEVIDTNNDGFITKEDLKVILASLCKRSTRATNPPLTPPAASATLPPGDVAKLL